MKLHNVILILLIVYLTVTPNHAIGCDYYYSLPIEPDSLEYVFIGKVVGYAGPIEGVAVEDKAWGFLVEVTNVIFMPSNKSTTFEVYPLRVNPACEASRYPKEVIEDYFKIGTEVSIIARKQSESSRNGNPILSAIGYNISPSDGHDTTNIMDYQKNFRNYQALWKQTINRSIDDEIKKKELFNKLSQNINLRLVEYRKDLYRLKEAKSEEQCYKILSRLAYYFDESEGRIQFPELLKRYISDKVLISRLIEIRCQAPNNLYAP